MWEEVSVLNLLNAAPVLQMPVFFFIGRHDHVIAPQTSVAYFEMLSAPSFEEPAKLNAAMADLVRPIM